MEEELSRTKCGAAAGQSSASHGRGCRACQTYHYSWPLRSSSHPDGPFTKVQQYRPVAPSPLAASAFFQSQCQSPRSRKPGPIPCQIRNASLAVPPRVSSDQPRAVHRLLTVAVSPVCSAAHNASGADSRSAAPCRPGASQVLQATPTATHGPSIYTTRTAILMRWPVIRRTPRSPRHLHAPYRTALPVALLPLAASQPHLRASGCCDAWHHRERARPL